MSMGRKITFTEEMDGYLWDNYLEVPIKRMASRLGMSQVPVRRRMRELSLVVPKDVLESRKRRHRFRSGQVPANKGRRMEEYMTREGIEGSARTRFKKGNLPHNTKRDGDISIRRDNSGRFYKFIRVAMGKWVHLHRHLWEQEHGAIPKGMVVRFRDGDTMNCTIDNLELVTRRENMKKNFHELPKELMTAKKLITRIQNYERPK